MTTFCLFFLLELFLLLLEKDYNFTISLNVFQWVDATKAYFQEAKWYFSGTIPTFHEYLENAWISIGVAAVLFMAFFYVQNPITKDALELFDVWYPSIIRQSSVIIRLTNDLATTSVSSRYSH